jgi:GNAT superfamily N-acetyltransferase
MGGQRLCERCSTFIYSRSAAGQHRMAKRYVSERLGYPDEGSNFERELGGIKYLFRIPSVNGLITSVGLWHLQKQRYDALILELEREIIGHTAFQMHKDNSLHVFSVEVNVDYRGKGLARYMAERIIDEARDRGIRRIMIGEGKHEAINSICRDFSSRSEELKILVHNGSWIDILS